jgi:hypothetical protein
VQLAGSYEFGSRFVCEWFNTSRKGRAGCQVEARDIADERDVGHPEDREERDEGFVEGDQGEINQEMLSEERPDDEETLRQIRF